MKATLDGYFPSVYFWLSLRLTLGRWSCDADGAVSAGDLGEGLLGLGGFGVLSEPAKEDAPQGVAGGEGLVAVGPAGVVELDCLLAFHRNASPSP